MKKYPLMYIHLSAKLKFEGLLYIRGFGFRVVPVSRLAHDGMHVYACHRHSLDFSRNEYAYQNYCQFKQWHRTSIEFVSQV
jgi:hypothetical protein